MLHMTTARSAFTGRAGAPRRAGAARPDTPLAPIVVKHATPGGVQSEDKAAGRTSIWREMAEIQDRLEHARREADARGWTTVGEDDAEPVGPAIGLLIDAAQELFRHTDSLEDRLASAVGEIGRLRAELADVREEATTDALTGVANRKRLDEMLAVAARAAAANAMPLSIAICDIDHFKRFNDDWGHQVGDQVLRFVGQTLVKAAGSRAQVGRYGGEEFVILMPGLELDAAAEITETARRAVEAKRFMRRTTGQALPSVTISAGVSRLRPRDTVRDLFARADARLYRSKHDGRNRVTIRDDQSV